MLGVIRSGQPAPGRTDNPAGRTRTMLKETFLHTRMLQWHWVGIMHWFVYAGSCSSARRCWRRTSSSSSPTSPGRHRPLVPLRVVQRVIGPLSTVGIVSLIVYRRSTTRARGPRRRFFGSTFWQAYFVEALALLEGSAILFVRARSGSWTRRPAALPTRSRPGSATRSTPLDHSLDNLIYFIATSRSRWR